MDAVLDTNVWLDWLVFDGKEVAGLRKVVATGQCSVVIDPGCYDELARVLCYPEFGLDAIGIEARLKEVRQLARMQDDDGNARSAPVVLPRCKDPDDQKFLALAAASKVDALVTRDKALLRLAARTRRHCGFDIVLPGTLGGTDQS